MPVIDIPPERTVPPPSEAKKPDKKGRHKRGYKPPDQTWFRTSEFFSHPSGTTGRHPEGRSQRRSKEYSNRHEFMQGGETLQREYRNFMEGHLQRLINLTDHTILNDPELALDKMLFNELTSVKLVERPGRGIEEEERILDQEKLNKFFQSSRGWKIMNIVLDQEIARRQFAIGLRFLADPAGERNTNMLGQPIGARWMRMTSGRDRVIIGHNQGLLNRLYHDFPAMQLQIRNLPGTAVGLTAAGIGFGFGGPVGAAVGIGSAWALKSLTQTGLEIDMQQYGPGLELVQRSPALSRFAQEMYGTNVHDFSRVGAYGVEYTGPLPHTERLVHSDTRSISPSLTLTDELLSLVYTRQAFFAAGGIPPEAIDASSIQHITSEGARTHFRIDRRHAPHRRNRRQPERAGALWQMDVNRRFQALGGLDPDPIITNERYMQAQREYAIHELRLLLTSELPNVDPSQKRITTLDNQITALKSEEGENSIIKKRKEKRQARLEQYQADRKILAGEEGTPGGERSTFEAWRLKEKALEKARKAHTDSIYASIPEADLTDTINGLTREKLLVQDSERTALRPHIITLRSNLNSKRKEHAARTKAGETAKDLKPLTDEITSLNNALRTEEDQATQAVIQLHENDISAITTIRDNIHTANEDLKADSETMKAQSELKTQIEDDHKLLKNTWGIDLSKTDEEILDQIHKLYVSSAGKEGWPEEHDSDEFNRRRLLHARLNESGITWTDSSTVLGAYDTFVGELDKQIAVEKYELAHVDAETEIGQREIAKDMINGLDNMSARMSAVLTQGDLQQYVETTPVDPDADLFDAEKALYDDDGNPDPSGSRLPQGMISLYDALFNIHAQSRTDQNEYFAKVVKALPPKKFAELLNNHGGLPLALTPVGGPPPTFDINEALDQLREGYRLNIIDNKSLTRALQRVSFAYADQIIASLKTT